MAFVGGDQRLEALKKLGLGEGATQDEARGVQQVYTGSAVGRVFVCLCEIRKKCHVIHLCYLRARVLHSLHARGSVHTRIFVVCNCLCVAHFASWRAVSAFLVHICLWSHHARRSNRSFGSSRSGSTRTCRHRWMRDEQVPIGRAATA